MATQPVDSDTDTDADGARGSSRLSVLRPFVVEALAAPVGPELVTALVELTCRSGDLTARELVEVTVGWKKVMGFATAGQYAVIADLDRAMNPALDAAQASGGGEAFAGPGRTCPIRRTADELAPALGIAPRAASTLVSLVRRCEHLPAAIDALADGRMDPAQLRALDLHARHLPTPARRKLEAAAVAWAPRRTRQQLAGDLAHEAIRLAPDHARVLVERGVADRDVQLRSSPLPGCSRLVADLPTHDAYAAWLALNGLARTHRRHGDGDGDERTLPQRRADLLTATLTGHDLTTDSEAAAGGGGVVTVVPIPRELSRHVEVHVVVSADTITCQRDLPASIPGIGPLDPDTARDLAAHRPWRRHLADPDTGTLVHVDARTLPPPKRPPEPPDPEPPEPDPPPGGGGAPGPETTADPRLSRLLTDPVTPARLDHGTDRYRPGTALSRHVHARDATCIGPACSHPAIGIQLDHTINYGQPDTASRPGRRGGREQLGTTSDTNLGSACERVHNSKTHGHWRLDQPQPGLFVWTSPTGRTYIRRTRPLVHGWHDDQDSGA